MVPNASEMSKYYPFWDNLNSVKLMLFALAAAETFSFFALLVPIGVPLDCQRKMFPTRIKQYCIYISTFTTKRKMLQKHWKSANSPCH